MLSNSKHRIERGGGAIAKGSSQLREIHTRPIDHCLCERTLPSMFVDNHAWYTTSYLRFSVLWITKTADGFFVRMKTLSCWVYSLAKTSCRFVNISSRSWTMLAELIGWYSRWEMWQTDATSWTATSSVYLYRSIFFIKNRM